MKGIFFVGAFVLLGLLSIFIFRTSILGIVTESKPQVVAMGNSRGSIIPSLNKLPNDWHAVSVIAMLESPAGKQKVKQFQQGWDAANSKPLNLYGKVIDQYGQPVIGAKIKGSVMLLVDYEHSNGEDHFTETDAQGRFNFTSLHGIELGIIPEKKGYIYDLKLSAKRPDNYYKADSDDPVVFVMWKRQGEESLVHSKIHDYIPCDGAAIHYDLLTGKKVLDGGDLIIRLIRSPVAVIRGKPFDWQISLEIIDGGLIPINDTYPYEAPADGYQTTFTVTKKAASSDW